MEINLDELWEQSEAKTVDLDSLWEDAERVKGNIEEKGSGFAETMEGFDEAEEQRRATAEERRALVDEELSMDTTIDVTNISEENLSESKELIKKEEFNVLKNKVLEMPDNTPEEKLSKKKAMIAVVENKNKPDFFDKVGNYIQGMASGAEVAARTMVTPAIGMAEVSEDIANLFRDKDETSVEDFRKRWDDITNKMVTSLGYEEDAFLTPKLGGQIAGETAMVASGLKGLQMAGKTATVAKTAMMEGGAAFLSELGMSGDYKDSVRSGALAAGITGLVGRLIEGKALDKATKTAIDEASPEELTNIANIFEFARKNDIKIVDAMLQQNPTKIVKELKSFNAPEALVDYAEELRTGTGKKLLNVFNDALSTAKPDNIDDISLRRIAETMQSEASALKSEMKEATKKAYTAMGESPLKDTEVSAEAVVDKGMEVLRKYRGDTSLINAFKRNVLKNAKTLDTGDAKLAKEIDRLENNLFKNQNSLEAQRIEGIDTAKLEDTIDKQVGELEQYMSQIDVSRIKNLTLEDVVGVVKDMNELKYSGATHIATKGTKEQAAIGEINKALKGVIRETDSKFADLADDASEKARETFELFGKEGRGTHEFPELEKIRMTNNPADIAKSIFKTDAKESGYKIEKTLEILGERNPKFQKRVMQKYINDSIGGFEKYVKTKNTVKQNVLDLDEGTQAIDKLIGSPESKQLTSKIIGEDNADTLFKLNNFIKQYSDNLGAMKTPDEKMEAGILSSPVIKQAVQLVNYTVYKTRNALFMKDKFHSKKYEKQVNKYVTRKLDEFMKGKKGRADWNKLGYSLSGSVMEKEITSED